MSQEIKKQLHRAGRELVGGFPGKGDALGALLGKGPGVFNNELNPNCDHAKLGLEDAIRAELFANAAPLLRAHARLLGYVCHRLPAPELFAGDASLLEAFSRWQAANGATCDAIRAAVDPDSPAGPGITRAEVERIAEAGERQAVEWLELLARFRQVAEPEPTTQQGEPA
jgi:hypothetical protein